MENLANLERLYFKNNKVNNIKALVENDGFGEEDYIDMRENSLNLTEGSEDMVNIQELKERGVEVKYEPQEEEDVTTLYRLYDIIDR